MEDKKIKEFIEYCAQKHNYKYDYSKVSFKKLSEKIEIVCPEHGSFFQIASQHKIYGCKYCSYEYRASLRRLGLNNFLDRCNLVHGNKYNYSLIKEIKNISHQKLEIICNKHGIFTQSAEMHMGGQGCVKCYREIQGKCNVLSQETVLSRLEALNTEYTFENVYYIKNSEKISVTCKNHGDFLVLYSNFLKGSGCPKCKESKGEKAVRMFLEKNKLTYHQEFRVKDNDSTVVFDFYIPSKNTFIEFQGIQHYKPIDFFGGLGAYNKQEYTDLNKLFISTFIYGAELIEVPFYYIDRVDEYLTYCLERFI